MWKYLLKSIKEENCQRCHLPVRILCITNRPWDSSQNCESHDKTTRLSRSATCLLYPLPKHYLTWTAITFQVIMVFGCLETGCFSGLAHKKMLI